MSHRLTSEIKNQLEELQNSHDGVDEFQKGIIDRLRSELGNRKDQTEFLEQTTNYRAGWQEAEEWLMSEDKDLEIER